MRHQSHQSLALTIFLLTFSFQVNRASWSYAETSLCCHLPGRVGHKWEETAWSCIPASTVGQSWVVQSSRLCCWYNKRCDQVILVKLSLLYTKNHWLLGWQVEPVILYVNSFKSFFMVLPSWVLWFLSSLMNTTRIWECQMWFWFKFHQPCYVLPADIFSDISCVKSVSSKNPLSLSIIICTVVNESE